MRSEAEIRQHLDNIRASRGQPCNCDATGHAAECEMGKLLFNSAMLLLGWVLGNESNYDDVVDFMEKEYGQARRN